MQALVAGTTEPDRLVATHLAALDDALIDAAQRFGDILGGGRAPADADERDGLLELHRVLDRLCFEYRHGAGEDRPGRRSAGRQDHRHRGLFSIRARQPLGLLGPTAPFDGELDDPSVGVIGGFGEFHQVDPDRPWKGGRWVGANRSGQCFPLTLSMLLFDSSGVNKGGPRRTPRRAAVGGVGGAVVGCRSAAVTCAVDWLLYDWLMAPGRPRQRRDRVPQGPRR